MNLFHLLPLFRTRPAAVPTGRLDRLFRNRRNPTSRVVLIGDVVMNVSDAWHRFSLRIPTDHRAGFERKPSGHVESFYYRDE